MKKTFLFFYLFVAVAICSSCTVSADQDTTDDLTTAFEDSTDYVWDSTQVVNITLKTTTATYDGAGVSVSGTTVTISKPGTYKLTGTLTNGQIYVYSEESGTVRLLLNGTTITNSSSSPFYIRKAEKAIINLVDGTSNSMSDASGYVFSGSDTEPNAALFSNCNVTIFGSGSLTVKGNYADGISTDDGLLIKSGKITVTAADDAIRGKDFLEIEDGTISATGAGHALKSDNENDTGAGYVKITGGTITATSTGADAVHGHNYVYINGGYLTLSASASQGIKGGTGVEINGGTTNITTAKEGIESNVITMNDGVMTIYATDDGINATAGTVNGGAEYDDGSYFYMKGGVLIAYGGGDAIDSNGKMLMTGGVVAAFGPSGVNEDVDTNGAATINGGTLLGACGSSTMFISLVSTNQYGVNLKSSSNLATANSYFHIQDASGNDLGTFITPRTATYFHISSPLMAKSSTYYIYTGGTYTGGTTYGSAAKGAYCTGGTYSGGTQKKSFSTGTSYITTTN